MDTALARNLILYHSGLLDTSPTECDTCFLSMFRPYTELSELPFAQLMNAILTYKPILDHGPAVDRMVVFGLWRVCSVTRTLVTSAESPVQRNKLASPESLSRIMWWVDVIETTSLRSLQGLDLPVCISRFLQYFNAMGIGSTREYEYMQSYVIQAAAYDDGDIVAEAKNAAKVLGIECT